MCKNLVFSCISSSILPFFLSSFRQAIFIYRFCITVMLLQEEEETVEGAEEAEGEGGA